MNTHACSTDVPCGTCYRELYHGEQTATAALEEKVAKLTEERDEARLVMNVSLEALVCAKSDLSAERERGRVMVLALEGIASGYGGAGGDDEGESFEETVSAMRGDAEAALAQAEKPKEGK